MEPLPSFVRFEYAETKDLLKTFFTLVTGTLVLSTTFAEKIVDMRNAGRAPRAYMAACWAALIAALVLGGVAMIFITLAAAKSVYQNPARWLDWDVLALADAAWISALLAGAGFVVALLFLVLATLRSLRDKSEQARAP
jgi:hypothetical protein